MERIAAVIGANFGDEGKGRVVDYLARPDSLVVRFNGGAQAGHTVVTPEGLRHVFHHFGSGSFVGAQTFLSRFFIVNPVLFFKELEELRALRIAKPFVTVDPECLVTTPWDMIVNQAIEKSRGDARHGSCGIGINETVTRHHHGPHLQVKHLRTYNRAALKDRLHSIRDYCTMRVAELDVKLAEYKEPFYSDGLMTHFIDDCESLLDFVQVVEWLALSQHHDDIIFEGAQGLLLDEWSKYYPYVTRSRTGLTNVSLLIEEARIETPLEAYYVTRPYVTRHGRGMLPHESNEPFRVDDTNVWNEWQEHLRFGLLDIDELKNSIIMDWTRVKDHTPLPRLFVSCVDHYDGSKTYEYVSNGEKRATAADLMLAVFEHLAVAIGTTMKPITGHGPTRRDVHTWAR